MREYTKRFADFERRPSHQTLNRDLMFLFGLTLSDFLLGVVVFLGVSWMPGFLTPFLALGLAVVVVMGAKKLRQRFPKSYFKHLFWAFGIPPKSAIKSPFQGLNSRCVYFNRV